jgi:hypothetical protein
MQLERKLTLILVCKGIFARSKLTLDEIRSIHDDFYDLPLAEETCKDTALNSLKSEEHGTGEGQT